MAGPDLDCYCGARDDDILTIGGGQNRSKAEIAQLAAFKYLGNARATGGPGILPGARGLFRRSANQCSIQADCNERTVTDAP